MKTAENILEDFKAKYSESYPKENIAVLKKFPSMLEDLINFVRQEK